MRRDGSSAVTDLKDAILSWVLLLSGIALVLAVGYILYGVFFASDSLFGAGLRSSQAAGNLPQVVHNLQLACTAVTIAGIVVLLAAMARYWMHAETGVFLLLIGGAFFFGVPYLVASSAESYRGLAKNQVVALLSSEFILIGAVFLGIAGIQVLIHSIIFIAGRAARKPGVTTDISQGAFTGKKMEKQDKFMGPCWTLPFCRDSAKRVCPVLHRGRPCWRDGHGCYCDQNIVMMLSGDRGRAAARSAQGFVSMQSLSVTRQKTAAEKRAQCLGCPIYLHRQNQKYRLFAPTCLVVVAGSILMNKVWIDEKYPEAVRGIGRALRGFSFSAGPNAPDVPAWAVNLSNMALVEWLLLFTVGLLVVGYLIHGVEWALYKLGI
jgi:hypothetical protein